MGHGPRSPALPSPLVDHRSLRLTLDTGALVEREGAQERMSQEIVRCPYCVLDSEFRPMFRRSKKSFVCVSCGHMAAPEYPFSKCSCFKCCKLKRITTRLSREHTALSPTPTS